MNRAFYEVIIVGVVLVAIGSLAMSLNWSRIEAENNAFAKECNERGKVAVFEYPARQCIAAQVATNKQGGK